MFLKMLLQFFTVDPTMIIILSLKYLAEELVSLGENTERYIIFIVPIEKEVIKFDKNGEENLKRYILHITIVDSRKIMASSFKIYPQEIHRIKCKYEHDDKKCKI